MKGPTRRSREPLFSSLKPPIDRYDRPIGQFNITYIIGLTVGRFEREQADLRLPTCRD